MKIRESAMRVQLALIVSTCLALITACAGPLIATYSQAAYEQATSAKVESLELMEKATEPYDQHAPDVQALMSKVDKAYEYAQGRPNNDISAEQWRKLKDPDRNLLAGFFKRWKDQGQLSPAFVGNAKGQISSAFDQIIQLESGKIRPADLQ